MTTEEKIYIRDQKIPERLRVVIADDSELRVLCRKYIDGDIFYPELLVQIIYHLVERNIGGDFGDGYKKAKGGEVLCGKVLR